MIVVGSLAARLRDVDIGRVNDIDLIGSWDDVADLRLQGPASVSNRGRKVSFFAHYQRPVEIELTWPGSTAEEFATLVYGDPDTSYAVGLPAVRELAHCGPKAARFAIPTIHALFALKTTHRFVSGPHFEKTRLDWLFLRDRCGARIQDHYAAWVARRTAETLKRKPPRLANMTKAAFFSQHAVPYVYDHDAIHRVVAHGPEPAYTLFRKEGGEVECSREKFDALPHDVKIHSVAEEAYVLAIERSHVPHGTLSESEAFGLALEKICCGIASGWWRDFAYEHLSEVWVVAYHRRRGSDYLDKFKAAVKAGRVPRVDGK